MIPANNPVEIAKRLERTRSRTRIDSRWLPALPTAVVVPIRPPWFVSYEEEHRWCLVNEQTIKDEMERRLAERTNRS